MANKPHIFIALTGQRLVFSGTVMSLLGLVGSKPVDMSVHMEMGCDIASMRNRIVMAAREKNATHILFVDYDMSFDTKAVIKLLEEDKDIIGAAYNRRADPPVSTAIPEGKEDAGSPDDLPKGPFKAEALGTGLMLIKMSVFDILTSPWFMWGYKPDGTMLYGEDTYFCQMAKKAGLEVYAYPGLNVKHIGEKLY